MNNVKNSIGWADFTWNPVVGCKNGCPYCYARKIRKRFEPDIPFEIITNYDERLEQPLKIKKSGTKIFVGSMTDLFAKWARRSNVVNILDIIKQCPQHIFMFLTKNPEGYKHYKYPDNVCLGATVTGIGDWKRVANFIRIKRDNIKFLSIEPLLDRINSSYFLLPDWIIIGGLTPKPCHKKEWVDKFLDLNSAIKRPIFLKDNLKYPVKIKEFPFYNIIKRCL